MGDAKSGQGTLHDIDKGLKTSGVWINNQLSGEVTQTWEDGSNFVGECSPGGIKDGEGRYEGEDGSVYEGEFRRNRFHGHGKVTYRDGSCYEGRWRRGLKHGRGEYRYSDGNVYKGLYKNNEREGRGKYVWNSGAYYDGTWSKGKQNGRGLYSNAKGKVKYGIWEMGTHLRWTSKEDFEANYYGN